MAQITTPVPNYCPGHAYKDPKIFDEWKETPNPYDINPEDLMLEAVKSTLWKVRTVEGDWGIVSYSCSGSYYVAHLPKGRGPRRRSLNAAAIDLVTAGKELKEIQRASFSRPIKKGERGKILKHSLPVEPYLQDQIHAAELRKKQQMAKLNSMGSEVSYRPPPDLARVGRAIASIS